MVVNTKLVSIIIPVYDVEDYLYDCIESVINQTYGNIEIILIDDGSPDNCPRICDEYAKKDNRIIVIHQKNGGLSNARNTGLDIAKGEYIFFLDSDDALSVNAIDVLMQIAVRYNADIVVGNSGGFESTSDGKCDMPESISISSGYDCCSKLIVGKEWIPVVSWNKLYRAGLFEDLRFPDGKIHEDTYMTWKLFWYSSEVCFTNQITYYYRFRENSIMNSSFSDKNFDRLGADEERILFFHYTDEFLYKWAVKNYLLNLIKFYIKLSFCNINTDDGRGGGQRRICIIYLRLLFR